MPQKIIFRFDTRSAGFVRLQTRLRQRDRSGILRQPLPLRHQHLVGQLPHLFGDAHRRISYGSEIIAVTFQINFETACCLLGFLKLLAQYLILLAQ